jgi:hypothetical protein
VSEDNTSKALALAGKYKWAIGGGTILAVIPAVLILQNVVALAVAGAVGFTVIQLAPAFAMKIANKRMAMIMAEAEANPIETLLNLKVELSQDLEEKQRKIQDFETEVLNFDDQVESFQKEFPEEADTYVELSNKMHEGLELMKEEQQHASDALVELDVKIKKGKAILKMALAAQNVQKLSGDAEQAVFQDIKQQIAFDSIRTNLNKTFAGLNTAVAKRKELRVTRKGATIEGTAKEVK